MSFPFFMSSSLISSIIFCSSDNSTISDSDALDEINLSNANKKSLFLIDKILSINPFLILSTVPIFFCFMFFKCPKFCRVFLMLPNGFVSCRKREFHPEPLIEPHVIVSYHAALLIQIYALNLNMQHASGKTDLEIVFELYPSVYRQLKFAFY